MGEWRRAVLRQLRRATARVARLDWFYRAALRYAVHDNLVTAAFSGLFLLKMASLFPTELDLPGITNQVEQLAQLLSEVAAERHVSTPPICSNFPY